MSNIRSKKKAIQQEFPDATLLTEELKLHDLVCQHGNHLIQLLHKTLIEMHATAGYCERERPVTGARQTKNTSVFIKVCNPKAVSTFMKHS